MQYEYLKGIEDKYKKLEKQLASHDIISNQEQYQKLAHEHAELRPLVVKYHELNKIEQELKGLDEIIESNEHDLSEYAQGERRELLALKEDVCREIQMLINPPDPDDSRNIIVEIRAGTGGDEASIFAADIFRMYTRYAEKKRWKIDIINAHPTGVGGFKEVIFSVQGKMAYRHFKYESGVHRVQRVPKTETSGRIHTSAVTVAVLPEVEEKEVEVNPDDLRIDTFCSSGKGGQSVNKTLSAIRITHLPTGMVVQCQDERSQLKNKSKAMKVLMARLREKTRIEQDRKVADRRKKQVGTGDRSEKIRTYNFPQDRITDHRLNFTVHNISDVMDGNLDSIVEAVLAEEQNIRENV